MFRCHLCQCVVPPRTPCQHQIVKQRKKEYLYRSKANTFLRTNEARKRKEYERDDPGGEGYEVVKEVLLCPTCAGKTASPAATKGHAKKLKASV